MKTRESKTCLLFAYHLATITMDCSNYHGLQQLPSCNNYRHVTTIIMHISSFVNLKKDPQLPTNF